MKLTYLLLAASIAMTGAFSASAATTYDPCVISNVQADFDPDPDACAGIFIQSTGQTPGDFTGQLSEADVEAAFGGDFMPAIGFSIQLNVTSDTATLVSPMAGYDYTFVFKAAGEAFMVLFEAPTIAGNLNGNDDFQFEWGTSWLENNGGNTPELSNSQAWKRITVVPLPAAGWMMLAGIGGLAALRRKKKA